MLKQFLACGLWAPLICAWKGDSSTDCHTVLSSWYNLRLTSPCVVVCIPLKLILQERRLFVCALSFLFVRTQSGRMVDCHVCSGAESPQDSVHRFPTSCVLAGYFLAPEKTGNCSVVIKYVFHNLWKTGPLFESYSTQLVVEDTSDSAAWIFSRMSREMLVWFSDVFL